MLTSAFSRRLLLSVVPLLYLLYGVTANVHATSILEPRSAWRENVGFDFSSQRRRGPTFVPGSWIVEFARPDQSNEKQGSYQSVLSSVLGELKNTFGEVQHTLSYDSPIFYGASVKIQNSGHHLELTRQKIEQSPNVISARPNRIYYKTHQHRRHGHWGTPHSMHGSHGMHRRKSKQNKEDKHPTLRDPWRIHAMTGILQQHDLGNFGQGVHICSADSGVDAGHPALNRDRPGDEECIGQGCPIINGINFIGDNYDGKNYHQSPLKASSVRDHPECFHGTYTAGHMLANDSTLGILGSSPSATASIYQISACTVAPNAEVDIDSATDEIILKAYTQALKDHCSVFSFSYGGGSGWSTNEDKGPIDRLYKHGILPVLSAGNDGEAGAYTVACGSCVEKAVSVASAELLDATRWRATTKPALPSGDLSMLSGTSPAQNKTTSRNNVPLWFSPEALKDPEIKDDGCVPIKENLSGKVAVLFRGTCPLTSKVEAAKNASAVAVILINGLDKKMSSLPGVDRETGIYSAMVTRPQGMELYELYKSSKDKMKISFGNYQDYRLTISPNPEAGLLDGYSSWGPGTSGAAPMFAGAVAVYFQVKGKGPKQTSPDSARFAFLQTAQPIATDSKNAKPISVFKQGHGLFNLTAAIEVSAKAEPLKLTIGDTPRARLSHSVKVTNQGKVSQNYKTGHTPAQSVFALHPKGPNGYVEPTESAWQSVPEPNGDDASVTINPATFTLAPGATTTVTVDIKPPGATERINMYSGYINFQASEAGGTIAVPYAGIAGDLAAIPTFVTQFGVFNTTTPALYDPSLREQVRNDTSKWKNESKSGKTPVLVWQNQVGSKYYQCDLVSARINFKATQPIVDDPTCCTSTLGDQRRETDHIESVGLLANGTTIGRNDAAGEAGADFNSCDTSQILDKAKGAYVPTPPGQYRALLRVQKLFAESFGPADYSSYLSHMFEIK
ncbi:unnamed protein product [Sympodiomycopsis kandeliae]